MLCFILSFGVFFFIFLVFFGAGGGVVASVFLCVGVHFPWCKRAPLSSEQRDQQIRVVNLEQRRPVFVSVVLAKTHQGFRPAQAVDADPQVRVPTALTSSPQALPVGWAVPQVLACNCSLFGKDETCQVGFAVRL